MYKKIGIFIGIILIFGAFYIIPVESGIQLTNGEGTHIQFFPWDSNRLTVGWRHSVERTPWEETYQITKEGQLSFLSTLYQSYGAGTPDTEGDVEFLSDGYIRVTGIHRVIPSFSLYYVPVSEYYLRHNSYQYDLHDYVQPDTEVHISFRTLNLYEWLWLKLVQ